MKIGIVMCGALAAAGCCVCPDAAVEQPAEVVSVDFTKDAGRVIRPLHGVNNSPVRLNGNLREFTDAKIPFTRTHDTAGAYGGHCYVDIPNLFPNFDADENDPASYRFEFTDELLKTFTNSHVKTFYRLGTTIENKWKIRIYNIEPPKDFAKWARVAEHVIMHFNEGWANGHHFGIEYWEIWNEPENPPMWHGTKEQFFEFYKVVSAHLKKRFPALKIGGYASCGFYALNREEDKKSDFAKSFLTWFNEFLPFVRENGLPLDFFSWHLYFTDPREIAIHSEYVRRRLDEEGFKGTENIFNEWNVFDEGKAHWGWDGLKMFHGASGTAAAFAVMQKETSIDKAMYYDALPTRAYCGLYEYPSLRTTHTYCSFKAFGELYGLSNEVESVSSSPKLFVLAASDGEKGAFFVSNMTTNSVPVKFDVKGAPKGDVRAYVIDRERMLDAYAFDPAETVIPNRGVLFVEYNMPPLKVVRNCGNKPKNVAGLQQ